MFLMAHPSAIFGTNCFVLAPAAGEECVVVDPGIEVLDWLAGTLRDHGLRPAAVLLTHGHIDHVYSVTPVCDGAGIPALIHSDDEYRLTDPIADMNDSLRDMLTHEFGPLPTWRPPAEIRTIGEAEPVTMAGLDFEVIHAPGHTEGSVMFRLSDIPDPMKTAATNGAALPEGTLLSGDVLFAGSIGRTDLPGGSHPAMLNSLRTKVLPQPDPTLVLPGHGPATTMARERATNPYLLDL